MKPIPLPIINTKKLILCAFIKTTRKEHENYETK